MRTLAVEHIIHLHREIIKTSGGTLGIRDPAAIESAVAQPKMTFDGVGLYPTLAAKAAALAHSLMDIRSSTEINVSGMQQWRRCSF